jgi:hypothetical protein
MGHTASWHSAVLVRPSPIIPKRFWEHWGFAVDASLTNFAKRQSYKEDAADRRTPIRSNLIRDY